MPWLRQVEQGQPSLHQSGKRVSHLVAQRCHVPPRLGRFNDDVGVVREHRNGAPRRTLHQSVDVAVKVANKPQATAVSVRLEAAPRPTWRQHTARRGRDLRRSTKAVTPAALAASIECIAALGRTSRRISGSLLRAQPHAQPSERIHPTGQLAVIRRLHVGQVPKPNARPPSPRRRLLPPV
jgi:hypothetical protein